jgi:Protein of unknown function (DUF3147)
VAEIKLKVEFDISALKRIKWTDYAVRFFFGGLITAAAGVIAKEFGPALGGLFLAFPAIFPASATLIEKSERDKKRRHGLNGARRGRKAASVDAAGAAMGCIGLVAFGLIAWRMLPSVNAAIVLGSATAGWLVISGLAWWIRKDLWKPRKPDGLRRITLRRPRSPRAVRPGLRAGPRG